VIAFLLDEMFPLAAVALMREHNGLDAQHVTEVGLRATDDALIADFARAGGRVLVTENVVDFANERDLAIVFVLKRNLPAGEGQAAALSGLLARWAAANPDPYLGHHWPI